MQYSLVWHSCGHSDAFIHPHLAQLWLQWCSHPLTCSCWGRHRDTLAGHLYPGTPGCACIFGAACK